MAIIEVFDDFLSAAVDAVLDDAGRVLILARPAIERKALHAASLLVGVCQRHPDGDLFLRFQAVVR